MDALNINQPAITGLRAQIVLSLIGNTRLAEPDWLADESPGGHFIEGIAGEFVPPLLWAALVIAGELGPESRVVTILCDLAERYFSTRLFTETTANDTELQPELARA